MWNNFQHSLATASLADYIYNRQEHENGIYEILTFNYVFFRHSEPLCSISCPVHGETVPAIHICSFCLFRPHLLLASHQPDQDGYQEQRLGTGGGGGEEAGK